MSLTSGRGTNTGAVLVEPRVPLAVESAETPLRRRRLLALGERCSLCPRGTMRPASVARWTLPVAIVGWLLMIPATSVGVECVLHYLDFGSNPEARIDDIRFRLLAAGITPERHADVMLGVDPLHHIDDDAGFDGSGADERRREQLHAARGAFRDANRFDARLRGAAFGIVISIEVFAIGYWLARRKRVKRCSTCRGVVPATQ